MIATSVRSILEKLNKYTKSLLEGAVGAAVTRSHYEIIASHVLAQALEEGKGDLAYILAYFKVNGALFKNALNQDLKELRMGNTGKPVFSPTFMNLLESAWAEASLNLGESQIRGAALVLALKRNPSLLSPGLADQFALISTETLLAKFAEITAQSKETEEAPAGGKTTSRPSTRKLPVSS